MAESDQDEIESARILIRENLIDEAKQTLFRIVTRTSDPRSPVLAQARDLLDQIQKKEIDELLNRTRTIKRATHLEDVDQVIRKLESDLQVPEDESGAHQTQHPIWTVDGIVDQVQSCMDLAIAFYEMGCYADSIHFLEKAERKIRIENTFLGEKGAFVMALQAMSLIQLDRAFDAKMKIEPVLMEPDLAHEPKLILYYAMGLIEESLGDSRLAKSWFQKIFQTDPDYRDVQHRIKVLASNP